MRAITPYINFRKHQKGHTVISFTEVPNGDLYRGAKWYGSATGPTILAVAQLFVGTKEKIVYDEFEKRV